MSAPDGIEISDDRDQVLSYLADITKELASVARRHGLDALGYLLDMAHLEAENAGSEPEPPETNANAANG